MSRLLLTLIVVIAWPLAAAAQTAQAAKPLPRDEARARNLNAYSELLRSDVRTHKVALITEMMQFTDAEDKAFWPVYREYEYALSRLNDDRLALIEDYARSYTTLTPSVATDLVTRALDLEARRTALKQTYFAKLTTALPPLTAAKVMQVEQQILLLVDLQIAASLPVLQ
jgi:hypothetical protein